MIITYKTLFTYTVFSLLILNICSQSQDIIPNEEPNFQNDATFEFTDEHDPNKLLPLAKQRPSYFSEKSYCDACSHLVTLAVRALHEKNSEMEVIDIIDRMFNWGDFQELISDKVREMGSHFISVWEEELIWSLMNREKKDEKHAVYLACVQTSKACFGMQKRQNLYKERKTKEAELLIKENNEDKEKFKKENKSESIENVMKDEI